MGAAKSRRAITVEDFGYERIALKSLGFGVPMLHNYKNSSVLNFLVFSNL